MMAMSVCCIISMVFRLVVLPVIPFALAYSIFMFLLWVWSFLFPLHVVCVFFFLFSSFLVDCFWFLYVFLGFGFCRLSIEGMGSFVESLAREIPPGTEL